MKRIQKKYTETTLERHVANWLNSEGKDGCDNGAAGAYEDLMRGGCQSGMVSHLIYYTDTVRFYRRFRKEIDTLLVDMLDSTGGSIAELFGDKWDDSDPLARDDMNLNLLAWFGFEEAARRVYERAEEGE